MRAVLCRKLGDPTLPLGNESSALELSASVPPPVLPSPAIGRDRHVRIRVAAASINFADALRIMGKYQERSKPPFIPGAEVSGVVMEVGGGVRGLKAGDRVCALVGTGGFAEEVVAEESSVFLLPAAIGLHESAALPIAFGTAHLALVHRCSVRPLQVVMVLGAAGGVGIAAVEIAKMKKAIVIAVARGAKKCAMLREIGADFVVDTAMEKNVGGSIREFLKAGKLKGVDILLDPVGGALFQTGLKLLVWGGQIVIIGFASGDIPSIKANIALVKNLTVHGLYWGSYLQHHPAVLRESMGELMDSVASRNLQMHISHTFPLSKIDEAFKALMSREVIGKVLVHVKEKEGFSFLPSHSRL